MKEESQQLSRDALIRMGLEGKSQAIAGYDEMLWKIRAGYVGVLYGSLTLIASLGDIKSWSPSLIRTALGAIILITGFTLCGLVLDLCFLTSKLRVVQTKENLINMALKLASGECLELSEKTSLESLLHNSGESNLKVTWKGRAPVWPILLLYAVTWLAGCSAILVLIWE